MRRGAFVLAVAGCWRSSSPPPAIGEERIARTTPPADARVVDEPPGEAPPDAGPPPDPARDCPSTRGVVGRVIGVAVASSGVLVTIGVGQRQGVDTTWHPAVTQPPQRSCRMVQVRPTTTTLHCSATPDQVRVTPYAVLCAP